MEQQMLGQPQTVKIFGIMHVILAGYGILMSAFALIVAFTGNPILKLMPKNSAMAAQAQMQAEMQEKMMPATVISTVITVIIAVLMLIAGIKLLKKRKDGLKWSNRYAWTSLAGKAVNLVFAFTFTLPLMSEMTKSMSHGRAGMPAAFDTIVVASTIFGVLIMCVYPILALVLLNRPRTKEWFAAQPV
jgi:predicted small integral membrane protein